jgi:hypothetical protein
MKSYQQNEQKQRNDTQAHNQKLTVEQMWSDDKTIERREN